MPQNLSAAPDGAGLLVTWGEAAANGAPVTAYHVSWEPLAGGGGGSAVQSGGAGSAVISGVDPGAAYRVTVAAENEAGRGAAASAIARTPEPDARSIVVGRGAETTYEECRPPSCAFPRIELTGFEPNTSYEITPYADEWGQFNPGATLTTDGSGSLVVDDQFPFDGVGQRMWVVVDGVESNKIVWGSG